MKLKFLKMASFQLGLIVFSLFYVTAILIWQYKSDFYAEQIYPIQKIDAQTKRLASKVKVGLHINKFPLFSFNKNRFIMDSFLWFKFEVGTESLNTIKRFSFQNTVLNNNELVYKSKPMVRLIDNDVVVAYHVQLEFKAKLDHTFFPIGDRRLNIILENRTVTPNELSFSCNTSDFVLSSDVLVDTWSPKQTIVQSGFIASDLSRENKKMQVTYPCVVFTIDFENTSKRDLITLYFPMFVIFLIGLMSLLVNLTDITRMALIAAALPILVLFRTAIDALSPIVGSATKVDFVYFLLVFLSLLILLFQSYLMIKVRNYKREHGKLKDEVIVRLEKVNNVFFALILALLILLITYSCFV